ncbi:CPBP family intramembrane glutamic endopeptidase [Gimibacter soli]|uniref:CPBP family intramembrane metalloprotease n=1 Tax=Gimibacter soli TaxID=3024400 RepID=A0AAE9XS60_9PROT|nr:CPBP family intramembrane glutamic endopeptidase [Gimibacter soli]WCL55174.1 CPBP family intramembrane metalloprotease [Gimibacter soli]
MENNSPGSQSLPRATGHFDIGALLDLIIILAVLVTVKWALSPHTQLFAGAGSTTSAMIVGTLLLRRRGLRWADLGFRRPESWLKTLGLAVLVFGIYIVALSAMQGVADHFFEDVGTSGRFDHVEGNLVAYLILMGVIWTHAAFFEELIYRAFFINRLGTALGGSRVALLVAVVLSGSFFGYRHLVYQGMHGALMTGAVGVAFGLVYLWFGRRNMWPLIIAHGAVDTIGITARFLGMMDD